LDICDSDGNLTGEKKTKKEAHDLGLWHRSVHVWIVNSKNEVLIQKRSPFMDNHPNMWDISAAGHVSAGEDYITSALRETEEELGLKIEPAELVQIGELTQMSNREGYINNEVNPVYIVKKDLDLDNIKKQYEEVAEVKFIPYIELKDLIESGDASFVPHPEEYKLLFKYIAE
ncbi:MAG: NUDIX domain-containing protein, partial [Patescibacteria group bacterium]